MDDDAEGVVEATLLENLLGASHGETEENLLGTTDGVVAVGEMEWALLGVSPGYP